MNKETANVFLFNTNISYDINNELYIAYDINRHGKSYRFTVIGVCPSPIDCSGWPIFRQEIKMPSFQNWSLLSSGLAVAMV